jgi:glutathione peroxidase
MSQTVYNFPLKSIKGEDFSLEQFKGKKILLVNTASQCGLTPQYAQLQELHENYKDKLAVVGLPCNDFGNQEPEAEDKVAQFCETNYHVTFPLTSKVAILGDNPHPLYSFLTKKELNGLEDSEVKWNFQKYLIDENGNLIHVFSPMVEPLSEELLNEIEK